MTLVVGMHYMMNHKGYYCILQLYAIPCSQHLIGANNIMPHDNDLKHKIQKQLPDCQPYQAVVRTASL